MFDVFSAASILGRHAGLVKWAQGKLPEAEQAVSEARGLISKHQSTVDALVPLIPKINAMIKDGQAFLTKHQAALAEIQKYTPEIQALINELLPLTQQAAQFNMANQQGETNENA